MKKVMLKTTLGLAVAFGLRPDCSQAASHSTNKASAVWGPVSQVVHLLPMMQALFLATLPVWLASEGQQVTGGIAVIDASTDIKDVSGSIKRHQQRRHGAVHRRSDRLLHQQAE
jgi:long-chain fatty acid transport protein